MDDSDLEVNETTLSQLIAPLGFHIEPSFYKSGKECIWTIKSDNGRIVICIPEKYEEVRYARVYDIKTLWKLICQSKMFECGGVGTNWKTISNPYLGCKSLEEAMVRKDLAYGC